MGGRWLPYIPYKEGQQQQVSMGTKQEPHPHWSGSKKQNSCLTSVGERSGSEAEMPARVAVDPWLPRWVI